jgi:5-methylcytosine-specific restriction endonuclease McrA
MKRMSQHAWQELRRRVYDRDNGHCVVCGQWLDPDYWECHHRRYRSRSGKNELANLIAVCLPCHTDRIHLQPRLSLQRGWSVSRFGVAPELIPVRYYDGTERTLHNTLESAA